MRKLLMRRPELLPVPIAYMVEMTESVFRGIKETIGRHPPETVGILGGSLDQPFRITDFRFCPPRRDKNGKYDRSAGHINVDHEFMNFVIDEEWRPNGRYVLGFVHSHPGMRTLSTGDAERNEGDMVFLQSCLRNDDSPNRKWKYAVAPIVTFDPGGEMLIDVWIVTLDQQEPMPATLRVIADGGQSPRPVEPIDLGLPLDALISRVLQYEQQIQRFLQSELDPVDRDAVVASLRRLRERELSDIEQGNHPLGRYVDRMT